MPGQKGSHASCDTPASICSHVISIMAGDGGWLRLMVILAAMKMHSDSSEVL